MEATAARWAERTGPSFQPSGGSSQRKDSFPRLEALIRYACESPNVHAHQRYAQENMDAHAAVCDEIILKGVETNAACHAVYLIVQRYINGPNAENAYRALQLLDSCVKNCGDPCHLAISEKELLNELVRRFGPTPPVKNGVQRDILKLIELWNRTIAQRSFIKDDLGYIRDMHRLLVNKGFTFPEPDQDDVSALSGLEIKGLQTEDALKERRNLALKAKLQAFLRRGGMRNLQEANKIIKVLSDYDQSDKAEIRQEAADRIRDVRERTQLLSERLKAFKHGDQMTSGDAFESLVDDLKAEQHKLHSTLQNDHESEDSMQVLLGVNEEINRVVEWYSALKTGNFEEANRLSIAGPTKGALAQGDRHVGANSGDLSLIDLDESQTGPSAQLAKNELQDDLLSLSLEDTSGGRSNAPQSTTSVVSPLPQIPIGISQPTLPPAMVPNHSLAVLSQAQSAHQFSPVSSPAASKPNYSAFTNAFLNTHSDKPRNPAQPQSLPQTTSNPQTTQLHSPSDPFASIAFGARASPSPSSVTQASKPHTPVQHQSQTPPPPSTFSSLLDVPMAAAPVQNQQQSATNGTETEDDWEFSGAPPPEEEDFVVFDQDVKVEFQISRASDNSLTVTAVFTNNTADPVSKLEFLTGMPKTYPRSIDPISSSRLQPHQRHGAYQRFTIDGVPRGQAKHLPRIKWKLSRSVREQAKNNQGEAPSISIN